MLPDDSFIVKLLGLGRFYPDSIASSLVGRYSHNYYDGSDSIPLSRGSRSRVPYEK